MTANAWRGSSADPYSRWARGTYAKGSEPLPLAYGEVAESRRNRRMRIWQVFLLGLAFWAILIIGALWLWVVL